jgi:hypothetical protein
MDSAALARARKLGTLLIAEPLPLRNHVPAPERSPLTSVNMPAIVLALAATAAVCAIGSYLFGGQDISLAGLPLIYLLRQRAPNGIISLNSNLRYKKKIFLWLDGRGPRAPNSPVTSH